MVSIPSVSSSNRNVPPPAAEASDPGRASANRKGASLELGTVSERTDAEGRITVSTGGADDKVTVAPDRDGFSVRVNDRELRYTTDQMKRLTIQTEGGADKVSIDTGGKDLSAIDGFRVITGDGDDLVGVKGDGVAVEVGRGDNRVFAQGSKNAVFGDQWGGKDRFVLAGDDNLVITGRQYGGNSGGTSWSVAGGRNSVYDGGDLQRGAAKADPALTAQLRAGLDEARLGAARPAVTNTTQFSPAPPPSVTDPRVFSPEYYGAKYPDLAAHGITTPEQLTQHWKQFGIRESRQGSPQFNSAQYLDGYPDLRKNGVTTPEQALQHYLTHGLNEGRLGALPERAGAAPVVGDAATAPVGSAPVNAAPANAVPANAVPANAVPANAVPANAVPANVAPANPRRVTTVDPVGARQVDALLDTAAFAGGLSPQARGIIHKLFPSDQPAAALDLGKLDAGEQEYLARALNARGEGRFAPDLGARGWSVQSVRDSFVALEHPDVRGSTFPDIKPVRETSSYSTSEALARIEQLNQGVAERAQAEARQDAVSRSVLGLNAQNAITADTFTGYLRGRGVSDADIQQTFLPVFQAQLDRYRDNVSKYYAGQGLPPPERDYSHVYAQDLIRDATIQARWPV